MALDKSDSPGPNHGQARRPDEGLCSKYLESKCEVMKNSSLTSIAMNLERNIPQFLKISCKKGKS